MNFIRAAAAEVALRSAVELEGKSGTDLTWHEDRGWKLLSGPRRDAPRDFETLVYEGFRRNPVVRACLTLLGNTLPEAPVHAYDPNPEGLWERVPGDELEALFEQPNRRDSYVTYIERCLQHYIIGGNTFSRMVRDGFGLVRYLIPIRPDRVVSAQVDENDIPVSYKVRRRDSLDYEVVPAEEILHIPDTDPLNEVFGMPRLLSAAMHVRSDNKATDYVSEMLDNHGSPGLIIGVQPQTHPDRIEEAEERFQKKFGPGKGRGKVGFVPGASAVREIGFSLRDLEFPDLRRIDGERICAVLGPIDPMLLSLGSASRGGTLSGAEHKVALNKLWVTCLIPLMRRWEAQWNAVVTPRFGNRRAFFNTDEIEALQESRTERFKRAELLVNAGSYTSAEIRTETGHDPDFPQDAILVQRTNVTLVPVEMLLAPPPRPVPQPSSGEVEPPESEEEEGDGDAEETE